MLGKRKTVNQDDGISSVIGIILMTALVVILASVLFTSLSGMVQTDKPKLATFDYEFQEEVTYEAENIESYHLGGDYTADILTIKHQGRESIDSDDLLVQTENAKVKYINNEGNVSDYGNGAYHNNYTFSKMDAPSRVTVGDEVTAIIYHSDIGNDDPHDPGAPLGEASVNIVYHSDEHSYILSSWESS